MIMPLKAWRAFRGMTQIELAHAIGYSTKAPVVNWERGYSRPAPSVITALEKAVGCKPGEIFFAGDTTKEEN